MAIRLSLPPLSKDDPLFEGKKGLLSVRNLQFQFDVPVPSSAEEVLQLLDQMVQSARVLFLDEVELYFVGDDDFGPFSPRNELESLNSIHLTVSSLVSNAKDDELDVLEALQNAIVAMLRSVGGQKENEMVAETFGSDAENLLLKWGANHGVKTKLKIAYFQGAGRGGMASEDINIGDTALEIPKSLIISEELVLESDMFDVLRTLDSITAETMLLLWSMRERYNLESKFRIYFETLPKEFNTGLNFGIDALLILEGTLLFEELFQAREHLRKQYEALVPALFTSYPDIFPPKHYTWEHFLWACELWYSNSMKIVFDDGNVRTCLVPIAGMLNHSLCPHVLRYGRMDPTTKSLKFNASRPCEAGAQLYLSYGSYPGSHLVTFYGFIPKGDNPYDVIPLDFDDSNADNDGGSRSGRDGTAQTTHMVRGTWLSKDTKSSKTYGLPTRLLAHLRAVLGDDDTAEDPIHMHLGDDDRAVLETVVSIFNPMMEGFGDPPDDLDRENSSWDVKLALDYKDRQRRIVSSILESCSTGLRLLGGPE